MIHLKKIYWIAAFLTIAVLVWLSLYLEDQSAKNIKSASVFGASFAQAHAQYLGLDWKKTYLAYLDDLKVRLLRLQANWNQIEPKQGRFNFADIDWQIKEAGKRGAKVILAVGRKLPHWPECHDPKWISNLTEPEIQNRVLGMLEATVKRYKGNPTITVWQLENEPFFPFGNCPAADDAFLEKEAALLRSIDARPILITDSGELSTWLKPAELADIIGTTMYRVTWNPLWGYFYYPLSPQFYRLKAKLINHNIPVIVSELQVEPWGSKPLPEMTIAEQYQSMNPKRIQEITNFAKQTNFSQVYLWGAEWWYYLKEKGHPEIWNFARSLF
ncbi:beta-galactosidase [Candidatus Daviesbacteria bacterium]|nr:beta-galactosidase [Candidatus Daviesbacteria bacterium]